MQAQDFPGLGVAGRRPASIAEYVDFFSCFWHYHISIKVSGLKLFANVRRFPVTQISKLCYSSL